MASKPVPRKIFWHLLIIFLFLSLGIWLVGYFYYKHQEAHIKQGKQEDLAVIMDLKIQQIINWRQERLGDARVIFDDQFLARRVQDYLQGKATPTLKEEILNRLAGLMIYQYKKIILVGGQGEVELCYPTEIRGCDTHSKELVAEAKQSKQIIFSDFYRDDVSNEIRLSLLIPILSPTDKAVVGVILLKIDPNQFLYPLIQMWPTPSRTAETVLLHREGEEVVFLNELRHQKASPLSLRFPLDSPYLCAATVARGVRGIIEGRDYRGRRVLAAGDRIPDSPWFLLAEVDQREIFAPISDYGRQSFLLLIALITGAGLGLAYVWRNQQAAFYRREYETERDKAILAQRYEFLNKYANDIILLADQDLHLLEANERAVDSYGYTKDELLRMSLQDLHPAADRPFLEEELQQAKDSEGLLFETRQQCKNGIPFPVEISLNRLEIEGQKFYQAIIRDMTRRKRGEEALRRSEASLAEAQRIAHLGSWAWDISTDTIIWSDEVYRIYGLAHDSGPPSYEGFLHCLHPEDLQMVKEKVSAALRGEEPYRLDFRIVRPDGTVRILHNEAEITFDPSGQPASLVGTVQDITELKRTEDALRESEKVLRHLTEQLMTAQETERRRISLLLHDELGQALMLFKFQLNAIKDHLRKEKSTSANDCLDMLQYLDGLIHKVRQLSRDLDSPIVLDELGFQGALRYLIEEIGKNFHIQPGKVAIDKIDPLFSQKALISIYRILQEGLMNIGRHANASQFSIRVKKKKDHVSFVIQDNGTGFDKAEIMGQGRHKLGLGILSMEERVRVLGGSIDIRTKPGAGTKISFDLPIKAN